MKKRKNILCLLCALTLSRTAQDGNSLVNFKHLEHLTEKIEFFGDTVSIIHVYSNYPDYHWVGAAESGVEGIACVDDAARAVVMYLRHYELTNNRESLAKAKSLLKFVLKMETEDGQFYNFILKGHSINTNGQTSYKSFGWWAARGVWCMSLGYRVFKEIDPPFVAELKNSIDHTLPNIDSLLLKYERFQAIKHYRIPQWLLNESGADVTSELLLGLIDYFIATNDQKVKDLIEKFSDGIMTMQDGDLNSYPFGIHRSWQTIWHMWGNGQTQALAYAGRILKKSAMVQSAEREAQGWYSRLLINGFMRELDVDSTKYMTYEQIAYGVRPIVVGLVRLFEATQKVEYLKMAGLAASWFFGNNVVHRLMYDSTTGRCFDAITDSTTVNKNSGAESTIEALYALVELEHYPDAKKYLHFKKVKSGKTDQFLYAIFRSDSDDEITLAITLASPHFICLEGEESKKFRSAIKE